MRFNTLQDWLAWQEGLNPKEIDLGLDRVRQVLDQLNLSADFHCPVITVAGTNGKGSTVAMLESILLSAGYSVACYTSPHLLTYNERIRIDGHNVDDAALCQAFERVDQARGDIPLTYFEFGTLAALVLFADREIQAVVLEVGLGGRLDAVNVINPDVSLITSVAIDHCDWLGDDIETIAREKAGILRSGRPAVYGGLKVPQSVVQQAQTLQLPLHCAGKDYLYQGIGPHNWQLMATGVRYTDLPLPALKGGFQMQNAAAALVALQQIHSRLPVAETAIHQGLQHVSIAGRFQCIHSHPQVIVDVAHNPQAAAALAELLGDEPMPGRTLAVVAMLADKAVDEVLAQVSDQIDEWFSAGLDVPRGLNAELMAKAVNAHRTDVKLTSQKNVESACRLAGQQAREGDRIIVFGSFYTVTQAIAFFNGSTIG